MVDRLKQPSTWWKIWGLALALVSIYYNLNYRVTALEDFRATVNIMSIETKLVQIQSDIERIKNDLKSNK